MTSSRRRDPSLRRALALGVVCAATACGQLDTRVVPLGPRLAPASSGAPVAVYRAPLPPLDAREVGLVEITTYDGEMSFAELIDRMRAVTRSLGGNALVWTRVDRTTGFLRVVGSALRVHVGQTPAAADGAP